MNASTGPNKRLKSAFAELLKKFTASDIVIQSLWEEIEKNHSDRRRHYHTLDHLGDLLFQLNNVKHLLKNTDVILFTLFYHDSIYNAKRSDNEERSAELAAMRMKEAGVPDNLISACREQILATKSHLTAQDSDTNYFTDADLSVLGRPWEEYEQYYRNIRKEYSIYPDFMYNPGRKKVLAHFLSMNSIFKTGHFRSLYEAQARENLKKEMELL